LNVSRKDGQFEQAPVGIHKEVALPSFHLLSRVVSDRRLA
jgi:hypothetical protein